MLAPSSPANPPRSHRHDDQVGWKPFQKYLLPVLLTHLGDLESPLRRTLVTDMDWYVAVPYVASRTDFRTLHKLSMPLYYILFSSGGWSSCPQEGFQNSLLIHIHAYTAYIVRDISIIYIYPQTLWNDHLSASLPQQVSFHSHLQVQLQAELSWHPLEQQQRRWWRQPLDSRRSTC